MHTDSASVDLTDQCQPTATRTVLRMLRTITGHNGTIRWPLRHNFSKVVLAWMDRMDQMCVHKTYACKDDLHGQNLRCGLQH